MNTVIRSLILSFVPLLLVSCGGDPDKVKGERPKVGITRERAEMFARSVETAMNEGNASFVDNAFDLDEIFERITEDIVTTDDDRESFLSGVKPGFGFAEKLTRELGSEGSFRLVHFNWNDERPAALYRIVPPNGSLNYVELIFGDRDDTVVTIDDVFMYNTGELFTSSMRRLMGADRSNPLYNMIASDVKENAATVTTLTDLVKSGEYRKALRQYEAAPGRLKNDKVVQTMRLRAAMEVGEEEYKAALVDVRQRFPNDPSLNLILIDHYYMLKQHDSMLVLLNRLDSIVKGDPYLNLYRALVSAEQGKYEQGRNQLEQVMAYDSTLVVPYYNMMTLALKQGDHTATLRMIEVLEQRFGQKFDPALIESNEAYAQFARSDEYRAWRERQQ